MELDQDLLEKARNTAYQLGDLLDNILAKAAKPKPVQPTEAEVSQVVNTAANSTGQFIETAGSNEPVKEPETAPPVKKKIR
jgi:hypothetical protein